MTSRDGSQVLQGRLPPQNLEAEIGVLGSLLLMPEVIDDVADILVSDHFYDDRNRKLFAAIRKLYDEGVRGIDAVTLAEELDRQKTLADVGGVEYLQQVLGSVPNAAHAKYYAKIVSDRSVKRSLIYGCSEILDDCYDSTNETDEVLDSAEQKIFSILEQRVATSKTEIGDILVDAFTRINGRRAAGGSISGLSSGFVDLDRQINGFQGSELIVLAARPAVGKTSLVCNFAESVAMESQQGCLLFSLEMSKLELAERLLCIRAKINGHRVRAGTLDDREYEDLMTAAGQLTGSPLYIDDQPARSISQIKAVSRRMQRRHGIGLIIIDYLQLIEPEDSKAPREQQVSQITRRLKHLSKELNVPVIALAQLNRAVESREDKKPRLSDLRESGSIEQDSDVVIFLHRPCAYDPTDRPGEADLIVAKNRNGPTGTVTLSWLSESMRFENMAEKHYYQYEAASNAFPADRRLPPEPDFDPPKSKDWRRSSNSFGNRDI